MITFDWEAGADTLFEGIANFEEYTKQAIQQKMVDFIPRLVDYARANAPWEDRSGAAREGLDAKFIQTSNTMGLQLYHTVDYGVWLEIRWGGYYAIILPTIETLGPELMGELEGLISNIRYYESGGGRIAGAFNRAMGALRRLRG